MKIDYSSLQSATAQLEKYIDLYNSDLAHKKPEIREAFRAAVIQAFEFTYELAIKMVRRQLAQIVANPGELRKISFADLMREAVDAGIIRDAPAYKEYREARNKTSHTYNTSRAEKTVSIVDDFLNDTRFLLKELEKRNDPD